MAKGKKSFIAYSDWKESFDELSDEDAGKLIKHIFAYVNDENPQSESTLIRAVFAGIKSTLKRDLEKWDKQLQQRVQAGIKSGESRRTKLNDRSTTVNEQERKGTVSVSVSVINKRPLSEIDISEVEPDLADYFNIALEFQRLFIINLKSVNASTVTQEKATFKNYVTPIRLMMENKEATRQDLVDVWQYLNSAEGSFWKKNILSTSKLREQMPKLIMSARELKSRKPIKQEKL